MTYPLYTTHAHLWSLISPLDSYEAEMVEWCGLVEGRDIREVLDLGSGGGHHLYHLVCGLESLSGGVAVDLSGQMLRELSTLLPQFETSEHDMTTLRMNRQFDLVTVHDSFCYLTQLEQIGQLFETIRLHLSPSGMSLVKLDAIADGFEGPYRYLTTFENEEREVTLTHYEWDPQAGDGWLEVVYLFLERECDQVTTREERHRLGLFSKEQLLKMASACGLSGSFHQLERWDEERENLLLVLHNREGSAR
jgi:SAM-dependent methyltransferase